MFKRHFFRGRKTTTPIFLFMLLFSFAFLLGCTNGDVITMPFTESQFYARTTDLNYDLFKQGYYDGNFVVFDGNKLSVGTIDISSADINWSQLINFPSGCSDNQAVKIVGNELVCIDLPTDTNFETAGYDFGDYVPYTGATTNVDLGANNLTVNTNVLHVDSTNDRVGIGTTTPAYKLDVYGTSTTDGINSDVGLNFTQVAEPTNASLDLIEEVGDLGEGEYHYLVSYTTEIGETRAYNIGSITTESGKTKVRITIPVSSDPKVTGRKLYRSLSGGPFWTSYNLATIANNTDTTYDDNISDATLIVNGLGGGFWRTNTTNKMITVNDSVVMVADVRGTSFGVGAGESITAGGRNAFFGDNAGTKVTIARECVYIGSSAGSNNISGNDNVAIGSSAGSRITSGGANVMIGRNAGNTCTGNSRSNTAIGHYAMSWEATAGHRVHNTALGREAGYKAQGNYNIFLGSQSGRDETGSYKLFIDSLDRGGEVASRTDSLIYGVMDASPSNQELYLNSNVFLKADDRKLYFGAGNDASITYDGTNLVINPKKVGSGIVYVDGNIKASGNITADGNMYATDFITSSKVPDIKDGQKALGKLDNISEWLKADKSIAYDKHYAGTSFVQNEIVGYKDRIVFDDVCEGVIREVCDYEIQTEYVKIGDIYKRVDSNVLVCENEPVMVCEQEEQCEFVLIEQEKEVEKMEEYEKVCVTIDINCIQEQSCTTKKRIIQEPIVEKVSKQGLSMETRVAEMEKMIWELTQELCKQSNRYDFCK